MAIVASGRDVAAADREWNVGNLKVPQFSGEISSPLQQARFGPFTDGSTPLNIDLAEKLESREPWQGETDSFDEFARQRSNVNEFLEESFPTWLLTSFYLAAARRQRAPLSSLPDLWCQI